MKLAMLTVALLAPAVLFAQGKKKGEPRFTIQGTIAQLQKPAKIYLGMRQNGENKLDSAEVQNGKFTFNGTIEEPTMANLILRVQDGQAQDPSRPFGARPDVLQLFMDKGTITITAKDSISKAEVKGSAANDAYTRLNVLLKDVNDQMVSLQKQYRQLYMAKDEEGMKKLEPKFDELEAKQKAVMGDYLQHNTGSPIALYVLNKYAGYEINPAEVEPFYKKLKKDVKNSPSGKQFAERLEAARKTAVGQPAMDFAQADTSGKAVHLTSFRGKYLLVDFWASWCGPCRAENPNVVKAYSKYKDKGFEILGVSLDDKKDKWLAAVAADNLTWTHVSDLKGWKNEAAEMYGIRAIPQNLLIDPQGKIIAKNLRGEALERKLEEVLH